MPNGFVISTDYGPLPPLACGLVVRPFDLPFDEVEAHQPLNALRLFWAELRAVMTEKVVLLDSTYGQCLVIGALVSLWPRRWQPVLILFGDMWVQRSRSRTLMRRLLLKFADRAFDGYIVQSTDERTAFPRAWRVAPAKVYTALFGYTFDESELAQVPVTAQDYIFAGGNPLRDYDPLLETARQMPDHRFIIATRRLEGREDIPSNVIAEPVSRERFQELMAGARMVITPLEQGMPRAAGQQTYMNAMRLGKLSVVNGRDVLGVRDYIEDGVTGLLVDGTPEGYKRAITWAFDPTHADEIRRIGERAKETVMQRFRYEGYLQGLTLAVDQIIAQSDKATAQELRAKLDISPSKGV